MVKIGEGIWQSYHNISECFYHIQLTVKCRKSLLNKEVEESIIEALKRFKERYAIEITTIGFDQNHIHILCLFLPKYSGGQVTKSSRDKQEESISEAPEIKKESWEESFGPMTTYISTISGKGNKQVIEKYIRNQGRNTDIEQLKMFEL